MLSDVVDFLACPHCGGGLTICGGVLRCERGHCFDVARHGSVSLLCADARTGTGDTAEMVQARVEFLDRGHYWLLAHRVAEVGAEMATGDGCVVDVGAGTAYHLAAALDALPGRVGVALDSSRYALRRAARAHPRLGAVRCDVWRPLPVRSRVAAVVLNVFAPRDAAEIARILQPGGALVVATPTSSHLRELVSALGLLTVPAAKGDRLAEQLRPHLVPAGQRVEQYTVQFSHADVEAVVAMSPSARHVDRTQVRRSLSTWPDSVSVTISVAVSVHRHHP